MLTCQSSARVAIVTGGSRGIGKAISLALAREGVDLAVVARNRDASEAAAREIAGETGRRVRAFVADAGHAEEVEVEVAVAAVAAEFGRIDILVNNAAAPAGQGPVPKLDALTDAAVLDEVNVKVVGYLRFARAVAPHMRARG